MQLPEWASGHPRAGFGIRRRVVRWQCVGGAPFGLASNPRLLTEVRHVA